MKKWLSDVFSRILNREKEGDPGEIPLTDIERLCEEIRQGDVLLVEGRSRVSEVIKTITYSPWTHAALYIGRLDDIKDGALQNKVAEHYRGHRNEQLILEAILGEGTVVYPVSKYEGFHLRICRPRNLSRRDRLEVIRYAINQLGYDYDVRHLIDLARFLFPWSILPRRWRSTLFEHNAGKSTRNVCSYMIAEAFQNVSYPILPVAERMEDGSMKLYRRNTRLFTPRDFDYSPYFDVIKHPYVSLEEVAAYRSLPWDTQGMIFNAEGDLYIPADRVQKLTSRHAARLEDDGADAEETPSND